MALQISAVFDVAWRHPLLCGSLLLFLTPSLFDLLLYFSPLLISTALFIVALISMGPRFEETKAEREQWEKGDQEPSASSSTWDSTVSAPIDAPSFFSVESIVNLLRPQDSEFWLARIGELKARAVVWIDNMLKAAADSPAAAASTPSSSSAAVAASIDSAIANVFSSSNDDLVNVPNNPQEQQNVLPHLPAGDILAAAKNVPSVEAKVPSDSPPAVEHLPEAPQNIPSSSPQEHRAEDVDMPELEIFDAEDPVDDAMGIAKILDDIPAASLSSSSNASPSDEDALFKQIDEPHIPAKASPTKRVHFAKESSVKESPANPLGVHSLIVKGMQARLSELETKRRNKYVEVLSRRNHNKLSPSSD